MAKNTDTFKDFVLDQLRELRGVSTRSIFGGHGLYLGDRFFGIIYKGQLYFRVSPKTLSDYTSRASHPFVPFPDRPGRRKQTMNSYYEVPVEILENAAELVQWAHKTAASAPPK
jgi:DNA transformation protein and related proteins